MMTLFFAIFGAIVGSFLNVCIYRLPITYRYDEEDEEVELIPRTDFTISNPKRSICPSCNNTLRWYHNIPVVSWLVLGGKCAFCKTPIRVRYPIVELLTAIVSILSFGFYGITATGAVIFLFCCSLLVISFIDLDFFIIPDVISIPGTAIGFAVGILNQFTEIFSYPVSKGALSSLYGFVAGAGFLWIVSEGYFRVRGREGLGLGDVKLLAMTGALFGPTCALFTIFFGSLLGCILGAAMLLISRKGLSQAIPFGPYLAAATVVFLFSDTYLLDLFYRTFLRI